MRSLLIRLLLWCLRFLRYQPPSTTLDLLLLKYRAIAKQLALQAEEKYPNSDEEGKRHWVFIRMCTAFPKAEHRDLGLAIELTVRDLKAPPSKAL